MQFLELGENDTLVSFNSNQVLESIETSNPSPALPVRADNDSEDEDVVMTPTISMDDDDSSLKQIFVVTEEGDITAYDEVSCIQFSHQRLYCHFDDTMQS